jgi:hypothetical protein
VKGVLQERPPGTTTWKAYGGKKVQNLFRPKGEDTWYLMGSVTSQTNGSFGKGCTAHEDGTWVPVFRSRTAGTSSAAARRTTSTCGAARRGGER